MSDVPAHMAFGETHQEVFEHYHITAIREYSHALSFRVVHVAGHEFGGDGGTGAPLFGEEFSPDIADAELFLDGSVKWDGCSNWQWHTEECMAHFCKRDQAIGVGRLLGRLYDIAAERLPTFDREIAGA